MNVHDVAKVATALGLGRLQGSPTNLKRGDSSPLWAAETSRGPWIIKTVMPSGAWWYEAMAHSGALELAARRAGVPTPEPADEGGDVGLWHDISGDLWARAVRRVTGRHPKLPAAPDLARWSGSALAAIERTRLPANPQSDSGYRLHPTAEWNEWIGEAIAAGRLDMTNGIRLAALVTDLNEVIATGRSTAGHYQRLHRDVSAGTILVTDSGPVLLDFDQAGPQVPWWEFVGDAFNLATPALGEIEPARTTVDAALGAYVAAGGTRGPADVSAFTGLLAARLSLAAYLLWISCGRRGNSGEDQAAAVKALHATLDTLPSLQRSIVRWASWLA